jgi:hypothetical protein
MSRAIDCGERINCSARCRKARAVLRAIRSTVPLHRKTTEPTAEPLCSPKCGIAARSQVDRSLPAEVAERRDYDNERRDARAFEPAGLQTLEPP